VFSAQLLSQGRFDAARPHRSQEGNGVLVKLDLLQEQISI